LLSVILGFVAPVGGSIRLGDCELSDLDPDAWRAQLAWMPQRPHLFAGSIADNVSLPRPDATEAELWSAVTAAELDAVVAARPEGMRASIGERGAQLSAGERQRVALARLFLQDAPLLLLDEPTANLDGETEDLVLAAVRRLVRGRTVIIVAHRPALVGLADRVIDLSRVRVPA
jgi:ABC-type multidrug transport system fused ATPase/permease subunit